MTVTTRNDAAHRKVFLRKMQLLQERAPCTKAHKHDEPGFDPDVGGHRMGCYPQEQIDRVRTEVTEQTMPLVLT